MKAITESVLYLTKKQNKNLALKGIRKMSEYLMGIDAGTGSVRATLYDVRGQNRGSHVADYSTKYPHNGWAEQDDNEWLEALKEAIPGSIRKAGIQPHEVKALSFDATTNTLVFLDENEESVRPPILWMDVRAAGEASEIDDIRDQFEEETKFYKPGFRADTMIPKTMWYKRHEPENYEKTETIMEFQDWLNLQLTGKKTLSHSIATFRWNYDDNNGGLPTKLFDAVGLDDVVEKIPTEVLRVGEVVGNVTAEAAEIFGLSTGTVVVEGTADCNAGMFGVGVTKPGGLAMIGGTSTVLLGLSEHDFHLDGVNGTYPNAMYEGTSLLEGGQTAAGSILTWFRNNLMPGSWAQEAYNKNIDIFDLITEKAKTVEPGAGGVVMMDYFQGNRAPYADSKARGMFWGLSIGTSTEQVARAIYEGVAYGANHCIISMENAGYEIKAIQASGGMAQSDFWMQLHSDVTGKPIYTTVENQGAGTLGSALIAAVGIGLYDDFTHAADNMVRVDKAFYPNQEAHEVYKFYMERYMETWPQMRDTVHKTVEHNAQ